MKTRYIKKIELEREHIPPNWMEKLVSNGKIGGVMLVFLEGFSESEIAYKKKVVAEFCKSIKYKDHDQT